MKLPTINPIADMAGLILYHTLRMANDPDINIGIGGRPDIRSLPKNPYADSSLGRKTNRDPSTGENTNLFPWPTGQDIPTGVTTRDRTRRRNRRRGSPDIDRSSSSSSSSDDEDNTTPIGKSISFMSDNVFRNIEIQYPVYLCEFNDSASYYSFDTADNKIFSSVRLLQNILIPGIKDGNLDTTPGLSNEYRLMTHLYRHVKMDSISLDFYSDFISLPFISNFSLLSVSVTAERHPYYTENDPRFLVDNYSYDKNYYFQVTNTEQSHGKNVIQHFPNKDVQDINNSSMGSWQLSSNLPNSNLSLNIGMKLAPNINWGDIDDKFIRLGYVNVRIGCYFSTTQFNVNNYIP